MHCTPSGDDPILSEASVNKIMISNMDGSVHRVLRSDALVSFPQFTLGGEFVTYREDYHIETVFMKSHLVREPAFKMIRINGTDDRIIVGGVFHDSQLPGISLKGRPAISHDGSMAALILDSDRGTQRLLHIQLQSCTISQILESSPGIEFSDPCFSADGSSIIYIRTASSGTSDLATVRVSDKSSSTIWSSDTSRLAWPQSIPNSSRLLFFELQSSPIRKGLRMIDNEGTHSLKIDNAAATDTWLPSISPDGNLVAYFSSTRSASILLRPDGTEEKQLTISPFSVRTFIQNSSKLLVFRPSSYGMVTAVFDDATSIITPLPLVFYATLVYSDNNGLFAMDTLHQSRKLSY